MTRYQRWSQASLTPSTSTRSDWDRLKTRIRNWRGTTGTGKDQKELGGARGSARPLDRLAWSGSELDTKVKQDGDGGQQGTFLAPKYGTSSLMLEEKKLRQEGHVTKEATLPIGPHLLPQRQYFLWRKAIHFFGRTWQSLKTLHKWRTNEGQRTRLSGDAHKHTTDSLGLRPHLNKHVSTFADYLWILATLLLFFFNWFENVEHCWKVTHDFALFKSDSPFLG